MKFLGKISTYAFVVTILWIGFILAISIMETPLRFQPDTVTLAQSLSIGRLVFHALNYVEIFFAVILVLCSIFGQPVPRRAKTVLWVVVVILIAQTVLLFTMLDQRTEAILRGEEVPKAIYHGVYIVLDGVKLLLLIGLAAMQIRHFEKRSRKDLLRGQFS